MLNKFKFKKAVTPFSIGMGLAGATFATVNMVASDTEMASKINKGIAIGAGVLAIGSIAKKVYDNKDEIMSGLQAKAEQAKAKATPTQEQQTETTTTEQETPTQEQATTEQTETTNNDTQEATNA